MEVDKIAGEEDDGRDTTTLGVLLTTNPVPDTSDNTTTSQAYIMQPTFIDKATIDQLKSFPVLISNVVCSPLRIIPSHEAEGSDSAAINPNTESLMLDICVLSTTFGRSSWMTPTRPLGAAMVVRQDGKPLHLIHVKALVEYCNMFMYIYDHCSKEVSDNQAAVRIFLRAKFLSVAGFKQFWEEKKLKEEKDKPQEWEGVECPI